MLANLNQAMDYIEEHLTEEVSFDELAKKTGISVYHFKRTFSFIAGMSLAEYIKKRRLAEANLALLAGEKVTDVAFKYGYQSIEGFSRAFRDWSGQAPSEVMKTQIQKTFPKFSFYIDIKGGQSMDVKLIEKPAFQIVGVSQKVPLQYQGENQAIMELAQRITPQQRAEMHTFDDVYPHQVVNASFDFQEGRTTEGGEMTHMIGFATLQENIYEDLEQLSVPAHTWAVFPNEGPFPQTLQETWARIFSEWLPSSGYQVVAAPEISFTQYQGPAEAKYSEIWLAVTATK
ncbi:MULTISPECIES: AraC family transcriptional regulator [Enterococcus]|jgi:AraC family transcriptional regulator|uniref:AraC family transcriptional regulator n=1 Tax=Enterococcus TaxID=1350 RepID=UPI0001F0CBB6|nr:MULTISPECIES: AraC family transcriptional regulator [Enterococcus]HAP4940548.1 AraC family transcriptional regulator [Enterococcus faecalis ADL-123]EFT93271.1 transcriptional regulator, effector binding domain protein [Enterococcus faecalis TX0012]EGO2581573.1 AraC family transcriptional regulator [Enterococcus faecalis]EGO2660696.1 AraC family transcriptional regulator [Enterococcus faecalis]EGO2680993.1 AraC family transcriptional regulator [Enterococcus faecalis]